MRFIARRVRGDVSPTERAKWLHECCQRAVRRLGIAVNAMGNFPDKGLLVSNHMGYMDILVLSSLSPCIFVSRKEVRSWPIFGPLAAMAGSFFIDRTRAADAQRINSEMLKTLSNGAVVVLFPEGTSSDGSSVLPFRSALFESVVQSGYPITPAHISYELADGNPGTDIGYWGEMTFLPHILGLFTKHDIRATVRLSDSSYCFEDRKLAAREMREKVVQLSNQRQQ